ncbi:methyltransferase TYW3-domain-containing protein [Microdochium bolleyi]|uniref:tRNA(Phe) 7-[(3-amino-3-carboxypropyl)-4-demethylwyosine(37)-N(4)]-methyltransferase n=1 Tax=Microdochium bolleyi TaxID=196109 RepID=A0A136JAB5_9PEZI|nr:methyltransferase TYW3-domain-containing protein [Microdochium bolleyi]
MKNNQQLPAPPAAFTERKQRILQQLAVPTDEYTDASPKGSIDVGIRDLIDEINELDGFVTTSSCAGRVSVFIEGVKSTTAATTAGQSEAVDPEGEDNVDDAVTAAKPATVAGVGGKGGGGNWLFVSHDPVVLQDGDDLTEVFGLRENPAQGTSADQADAASRLIHFKFEPMILHVLTASPEHAQLLLRCGLQAGFRESGAINITSSPGESVTPMVAIRSMGLLLESLVGEQLGGQRHCSVTLAYMRRLLDISNQRFEENTKRIARFRAAVLEATTKPTKKDGTEWEDAEARRARKREEGLRRREELAEQQRQRQDSQAAGNDGETESDLLSP